MQNTTKATARLQTILGKIIYAYQYENLNLEIGQRVKQDCPQSSEKNKI